MKKILVSTMVILTSYSAIGQVSIDKAVLEQRKKDKQKSDEAIADPKKNTKAQLWIDRATLYNDIALTNTDLDSAASFTAYDALKKAVELDTKDGKQGALAKKAASYLAGEGKPEEGAINIYGGLLTQAVAKFQNKNYNGAMKYFDAALGVKPKDTTAALYGAYSALQSQKNSIAAPLIERYITNGGKDQSNFAMLAQIYRLEKSWDKANAVLDKGVSILPASALAFKAEKVNVLLDAQRTAEAKALLKELVTLDPKTALYPTNLAILNDNQASNLNQDIKKMKAVMGGVAKAKKKLDDENLKASDLLSEQKRISDLIKKQPKNADLKRQLADVQKRQTDSKAAIAEAATAVTKAETDAKSQGDVPAKIAELTAKKAEYATEAVEYYKKAIGIDPKNYEALFNMGVFYFNDAVDLKGIVDDMDMKDYNATGKGIMGKACGKFKQAISYFNRSNAIRVDEIATESIKNAENIIKKSDEDKIVCEESK